jgi:hypothetical protein
VQLNPLELDFQDTFGISGNFVSVIDTAANYPDDLSTGWQTLSMAADQGYTFTPALRDFQVYHKTV